MNPVGRLAFVVALTAPAAWAEAPCQPEPDGRFTPECHDLRVKAAEAAQHARSYDLGYGDGCAAAGVGGNGTFVKRVTPDTTGGPTFACVRSEPQSFGLLRDGFAFGAGGTSSFIGPLDLTSPFPSNGTLGGAQGSFFLDPGG